MLYLISQTELKILKRLFGDLTKRQTIREIAIGLKLPYPQIHRSVKSLENKGLVSIAKSGKSSIIYPNQDLFREEFVIVEAERKIDILDKYSILKIINKDLERIIYTQFICILFGSYAAGTAKKESDIDLLFVIPEEYDYGKFEKNIKNAVTVPKTDIQVTTEKGLIEMWNTPSKLNVGNELLKNHIILRGAEAFLHLRRKYYVG